MTAFTNPFGSLGAKRAPTTTEKEQGLPCGPLDRFLWTFIINRLEGNIKDVMDAGGVSALAEDDATALRRAIEAMIAAATGGGDTSQFVLFSQARARLPIFPDVQNVDGRIGVSAPATGTVRLAGGVTFLHRGIFPVTTAQTDFATDSSKTYHLRWDTTNGFRLLDLASGTYNPSALAESNAVFDSTFDDMLVARVVTNSSNVATITTLANKARLTDDQILTGPGTIITTGGAGANDGAQYTGSAVLNWSRAPLVIVVGHVGQNGAAGSRFLNGYANAISGKTVTRYGASATVTGDWDSSLVGATVTGQLSFQSLAA